MKQTQRHSVTNAAAYNAANALKDWLNSHDELPQHARDRMIRELETIQAATQVIPEK